ncbi:MAG: class I adenylate-forming enzyme family protein [Pseudomonadota bacterium]
MPSGSLTDILAALDGNANDVLIFIDKDQETHISGVELYGRINAAARRIHNDLNEAVAHGHQTRSIGIMAENAPEHFITGLAALLAGATAVPINYKLQREGVEFICADAGVAHLYSDKKTADLAPETVRSSSIVELCAEEKRGTQVFEPQASDDTNPAFIMYTSGSTGKPKGVPITDNGYNWTLSQFAFLQPAIEGRKVLIAAPLYHMNAQFHILTALKFGGCAVLMSAFDARDFIRIATDHSVSRLTGVPTMFELSLREISGGLDYNRESVHSIAMGSAPVTDDLLNRLKDAFPKAKISNGYGTTEVGPAIFGVHPDGLDAPPLSIGYPMPGVELRLVDEDGQEADQGVLFVRSPMTAKAYLNRPEASAEKFVDGWYNTGDVMRRDRNGFYFFVGRDDDMFVCGGENIYPGAVENVLTQLDGIVEAAVVPVPDKVKGALPAAFIVASSSLDEAAIKQDFIKHGPAYAHPRFIHFLDALPLTAVKKVDRRSLELEAQRRFGAYRH